MFACATRSLLRLSDEKVHCFEEKVAVAWDKRSLCSSVFQIPLFPVNRKPTVVGFADRGKDF